MLNKMQKAIGKNEQFGEATRTLQVSFRIPDPVRFTSKMLSVIWPLIRGFPVFYSVTLRVFLDPVPPKLGPSGREEQE